MLSVLFTPKYVNGPTRMGYKFFKLAQKLIQMKVILEMIMACKDDQVLLRSEIEAALQLAPGILLEHVTWSGAPRQPS